MLSVKLHVFRRGWLLNSAMKKIFSHLADARKF